jgi:hypothetical protein
MRAAALLHFPGKQQLPGRMRTGCYQNEKN